MTAKDRLLTENEAKGIILKGWCSPETTAKDIAIEPWVEAIRDAQDAKTLRMLRPVIEWAARGPCLGSFSDPVPCGHCATCQARALLVEMDKSKAKGKEG